MKPASSHLSVLLYSALHLSPPVDQSQNREGGQADRDHMILEFYLWYCTLNYFEKYFTPTTLRTGKSSTFKKNWKSEWNVFVARQRIIRDGGWETLKNSILSSP